MILGQKIPHKVVYFAFRVDSVNQFLKSLRDDSPKKLPDESEEGDIMIVVIIMPLTLVFEKGDKLCVLHIP